MATSSKVYQIFQGSPAATSTGVTLLGTGSAGTHGAARRLTHPVGSSLAPISYPLNPSHTTNLDNDVLVHPIAAPILTLSSTRLARFETALEDRIVVETWEGGRGAASMPTYFFRLLYNYLISPPAFSATAQTYVTWEPRDRNDIVYNVLIVALTVGDGQAGQEFRVRDRKTAADGGGFAGISSLPSGVELDTVKLSMLVVSKVE